MTFDTETVNRLLTIDEPFKAPDRLMDLMFHKLEREHVFREFLKVSTDVSFDWFHEYFEDEQADRKNKKQDFTPPSVAKLLVEIIGTTNNTFEPTAGTGGITITKWWQDCLAESPLTYLPSEHLYYCEEMSDRAVPFLLFNLAIRGMNAIVWHGDSLERTCRGIFFLENTKDDFMAFSDVNVMPYNTTVQQAFNIKKWVNEAYPEHLETDSEQWAANVSRNLEIRKRWSELFERNTSY
ncbi:N-6 DNA methylase [Lactobacillus plantarum]|uniref:N-6 DNA methylase n=1 Tax=Lactiplantibacillus plantarum TaxID=1590 RepID=UPI00143DABE3|nr:N-6 DNA methylase [Lactiplantibacillus plantarum]MBE1727415.1 N-6 DNA methylase [Lactiplantibacillus plantarum]NKI39436.1 N-6 DNA methylase [Lactiplantibacillus plantarum]